MGDAAGVASDGSNAGARGRDNEPAVRGWWATPGEGRARDARAGLKGDRAVEGEVRDRVEEWSLMATHAVI